jgi:GT2 family glycosyltransferase/glycosyltransferase involved in cell wall biosynthesis
MLSGLHALLLVIFTILLLPFLLALGVILVIINSAYWITGFARKPVPTSRRPDSELASIIVLNWNGKALLSQGLPSILEAVRVDGRPHEIMVVDNGSSDGSLEYVGKHFPGIRVLALQENLGFAEGNNAGVRAARHDIVVLLNNDMVVDPGFLRPLLRGFGPDTFAVTSQIYLQDSIKKREETGRTVAVFRRGMIDYAHREFDDQPHTRSHYPVFWAGGGSSAFHREKFLSLGGFRSIYSPAYVEDADLSYQAWKAGWEVLLAPESVVYHKHRTSTARLLSPSQLQSLLLRNQFLFIWKNVREWSLFLSHVSLLPWNCYRLMRDHGAIGLTSIVRAVMALSSNGTAQTGFRPKRTDSQIFNLASKPGLYFGPRAIQYREETANGRRPHVLWVTAYLPHTGRHAGAGRMFQLLKRLALKYRITLVTFLESDEEKSLVPEVELFCERVIALRRSRPPRLQLFAYEPFDEFLTPEMDAAVDSCLAESDFRLIQLEYTQMAVYATRVAGVPTLLTKHEVDFAACARRARTESGLVTKLRWFYNYLQVLDREVKLTSNVDAVVCMTDPDARELRKFIPSVQTHTINTGVDLEYFCPPSQPPEEARLIFVGAFQHLPNVEAMLHFCRSVFPIIRQEAPGTELLIVGSNPTPAISHLATLPGVNVTGFVPDIRPYMAKSSVYVVPLRLGVGIRGKILEAWGMCMAVVSTSVGCAGLRYEHDKNILVADTPENFARHVLSLINDQGRRRRLGDEGRKTVEQFYSWERSAHQLDALYQKLITAKSPASNAGNPPGGQR